MRFEYSNTHGLVRVVIGLLLILLLAAALNACNGSDNGSSSTPGPDGSSSPTGGSSAGSLQQLAAKYAAGVDAHVKYAVDSDNFGVHPQGTWITYRLGNKIREDWMTNNFGYDETNVAINTGDAFIFCNKTDFAQSCGREADPKALELVFKIFTPVKDIPSALLTPDLKYTSTELPDETLGGVDAKCFDVQVSERIGEGKPGTEKIKLCFKDDGALLRLERRVTFEDPTLPEAWITAVAQEATEAMPADFEPLATPTQH